MERFVARRNIAHFEELLSNEADPNERRILEGMIREERAKLAVAEARSIASPIRRSSSQIDRVTC